MKLLIVEQSDRISNIYKKIFDEKKYEVDFAKNELECLDKFDGNYDCVVLEKSTAPENSFEDKLKKDNPNQKISFIPSYLKSDEKIPQLMKETREIVEKPFAMLTLITKLELERQRS